MTPPTLLSESEIIKERADGPPKVHQLGDKVIQSSGRQQLGNEGAQGQGSAVRERKGLADPLPQ